MKRYRPNQLSTTLATGMHDGFAVIGGVSGKAKQGVSYKTT
jgi:hypothetical protein